MRYILRNVRLAFPKLYEAEAHPESPGQKKHSARFLLPPNHPQLPEIRQIIEKCFKDKFGAKWAAVKKAAEMQPNTICLRDGNLKADLDGFAGNFFISANSKENEPPSVFTLNDEGKRVPANRTSPKPYGGCYVDAIVEFYAYDRVNKGVSAKLCGVAYVADGDAFSAGGGAAGADEFDDLGNSGQATKDPLAD